jgi:peptidoglycan/LPS O-acetylase OafA/YrhL
MKYRPEIDGLRALAVIPVVLFHAGVSAFSGGFVGVDVFFVISGYLITSLLIRELDTGGISIVEFYERRCRRILPALFVVTAVCVPFAWMWLPPDDMLGFSQSALAVALFASNIFFWQESGYFDTAAELKPLLHTWSLAVEEQFYILFPLLLAMLWPLGRQRVLRVLVIIGLCSLLGAQRALATDPMAAFFLLWTRGWELLLGALVALWNARPFRVERLPPFHELLAGLGLLLIGLAVFAFDRDTPFPGLRALIPTVGTALVIRYGSASTRVGKLLASAPLVAIGLISYSVYLWHQPVLAFARIRLEGGPTSLQLALLLAAIVVLAMVSWRYVETPFRRRGAVSRRQIFAAAGTGSVLMAAFGLAGIASNGFFDARVTTSQAAALSTAVNSPKRFGCHMDDRRYHDPAYACEYHTGEVTWAVFGDSHTVEVAYALAEELRLDHQALRHYSLSSCSPAFRTPFDDGTNCSRWTMEAVRLITADPAVRNVLVSYRLQAYLYGGHEGVYPELPNEGSDAQREQIWRSYVELLRHFVAAGKTVVLVLQAPEIRKDVSQLILARRFAAEDIEGISREWWDRRTAFVRARLHQIPPEILVVDPADLFCDRKSCAAVRDSVALYFDDDHMSVAGARLIAAAARDRAIAQHGAPAVPSQRLGHVDRTSPD